MSGARTDIDGRRHAAGEITLGDQSRAFDADLDHWSMSEYQKQWTDAVVRLAAGPTSSVLVASYHGEGGAGHAVFPMWREGSTVFIRGPVATETLDAGDRATTGTAATEVRLPLGQLLAFAIDD